MFGRNKSGKPGSRLHRSATSGSLDQTPELKYEKPKILLVDCIKSVEVVLKEKGFNVLSGTFGTPYRIQKANGYCPLIVSPHLPNYTEQEIVVVDLRLREPLDGPIGEKHQPDGELDWWVKCNRDSVDPTPRAMAMVQESFYRILNSGGIFIVFANKKVEQDLLFARLSQSIGLKDQTALPYNNWSFLPLFFQLEIVDDSGSEIYIEDNLTPIGQLLEDSLEEAAFTCTLSPNYSVKHLWKTLATNKYGQPVSLQYSSPDGSGTVLVFPQLKYKSSFLLNLLKNVLTELTPELFPDLVEGKWVHRDEYELQQVISLSEEKLKVEERARLEIEALNEKVEQARSELGWLHELLTAQDKTLVDAVRRALHTIGFESVTDVDDERDQQRQSRREDLQIHDSSPILIVDVKGIAGVPADGDVLQADKHATIRMREWKRTDVVPLSIINHQRHLPPLDRENRMPFRKELLDHSEVSQLGMMTTWDLYRLVRSFQRNAWESDCVKPLFYQNGRIGIIPLHYDYIGKVAHVWKNAFSVLIEAVSLCNDDRIGFELPTSFEERDIASLQLDDVDVNQATLGNEIGIKTTQEPPKVKEGTRVFRVRKS